MTPEQLALEAIYFQEVGYVMYDGSVEKPRVRPYALSK